VQTLSGVQCHRVGSVHRYRVLVDMISVHVMKMAVVKIVNVVSVLHRRVPTSWTVLMGMIGVFLFSASRHGCASLSSACPLRPQLPPPAMRTAGISDKQVSLGRFVASG
jgi:hypothetical protein